MTLLLWEWLAKIPIVVDVFHHMDGVEENRSATVVATYQVVELEAPRRPKLTRVFDKGYS